MSSFHCFFVNHCFSILSNLQWFHFFINYEYFVNFWLYLLLIVIAFNARCVSFCVSHYLYLLFLVVNFWKKKFWNVLYTSHIPIIQPVFLNFRLHWFHCAIDFIYLHLYLLTAASVQHWKDAAEGGNVIFLTLWDMIRREYHGLTGMLFRLTFPLRE